MDSKARQVSRVLCYGHNLIVLESKEPAPEGSEYAFHHAVVCFTPDKTQEMELALVSTDEHYMAGFKCI
jgi:hypothetical protein